LNTGPCRPVPARALTHNTARVRGPTRAKEPAPPARLSARTGCDIRGPGGEIYCHENNAHDD
jgi:hypothetical protein